MNVVDEVAFKNARATFSKLDIKDIGHATIFGRVLNLFSRAAQGLGGPPLVLSSTPSSKNS